MFRQWSAIFKECTETGAHESNTSIQVKIALNVTIKILKLYKTQRWKVVITQRWHKRYAMLSIFKYSLTAV